MAVSQNTQRGMYARHASTAEYVGTREEAERLQREWRQSGYYRRVQIYGWNSGTKERPRREFKVLGWGID